MAFKRRYNPGCECCTVIVGSDFNDYSSTFEDCFSEGTDAAPDRLSTGLAGVDAADLLVELQKCHFLICGLVGFNGSGIPSPIIYWDTDQTLVIKEWIESGGRMILSAGSTMETNADTVAAANTFLSTIGSSMNLNRTLEDGSCQDTINIPDVPIVDGIQYVHGPTSTINEGSATVIGYTTDSNTPFICVEQLGNGYIMLSGTYYAVLGCDSQMNCGLIKNFVKLGTLI